MTLKLEHGSSETIDLRSHYQQVASNTAKLLWRRKQLVAVSLITFPVLAFLVLVLMGPRYTAESMIQLGFGRTGGSLNTKTQEFLANLDASVLVDSAARLLRSRAVAGTVVTRLGLDEDPQYTRDPLSLRALRFAKAVLGLPEPESTPHDRAVNALLRRISVNAQPRSYVISIAATEDRPESARALVGAVASAYLQSRMLQEVSTAENELKEASTTYGPRHPQYQLAEMKLRHLQAELNDVGEKAKDGVKVVAGDSFLAGDVVVGPSSALIGMILGIALVVGLVLGTWMALHGTAVKRYLDVILRKIRVHDRTQAPIWPMKRIRRS